MLAGNKSVITAAFHWHQLLIYRHPKESLPFRTQALSFWSGSYKQIPLPALFSGHAIDFTPKGGSTWVTPCFLKILGEFPQRFKDEGAVYFWDMDCLKNYSCISSLSSVCVSGPGYTKGMNRLSQEGWQGSRSVERKRSHPAKQEMGREASLA